MTSEHEAHLLAQCAGVAASRPAAETDFLIYQLLDVTPHREG